MVLCNLIYLIKFYSS